MFKMKNKQGGDVAQLRGCLSSIHTNEFDKISKVAHTCNPSTLEVEAGGSGEVQGYPLLHREF